MQDTVQDNRSRQRGKTGPLMPGDYANVVKYFYDSTAIGDEFASLSHFLNDPNGYKYEYGSEKARFLTAYEFSSNTEKDAAPDWDLGEAVKYSYAGTEEYWRKTEEHWRKEKKQDTPGRLLFLHGCPSQGWLNVLGAAHGVDPEMFRRWMDTHAPDDRNASTFFFPPLPTYAWNLLELPVVTIGKRDELRRLENQQHLDQARKDSATAVRDYLGRSGVPSLHMPSWTYGALAPWERGQSVIRDVCVLDHNYLAIEQRLTVCMVPAVASGKGWQGWTVLVWSDAGDEADMCRDLVNGPWKTAPEYLKPNTCHAQPTTGVYRPNMALTAYSMSEKRAEVTNQRNLPTTAQLHIDYGRYLRPEIMARDPFYALREVLDVAAASERQFLNLVERILGRYMENLNDDGRMGSGSSQFQGLSSFLYLQQVLLHHTQLIQRARESIEIIASHVRWQPAAAAPAAANSTAEDGGGGHRNGNGNDRSQSARMAAAENYRRLHEQAQMLTARCRESIQNLQYAMSIAESRKGLEQAGRVTKLTYLASFFVPLAFTTSFFGMNLKVLDKVPTRIFVAVSVPIVVLTVIIVFFNELRKLIQWFMRFRWRRSVF